MKTMKTKINQWVTVALFGLLTLVGNVSAKGTEVTASSRENIKEPALQMESWIMDDKIWDGRNTEAILVREDVLQLEEWMIDENKWMGSESKISKTEMDSPIILESWMLNEFIR